MEASTRAARRQQETASRAVKGCRLQEGVSILLGHGNGHEAVDTATLAGSNHPVLTGFDENHAAALCLGEGASSKDLERAQQLPGGQYPPRASS